jgi:hypothetical protein
MTATSERVTPRLGGKGGTVPPFYTSEAEGIPVRTSGNIQCEL